MKLVYVGEGGSRGGTLQSRLCGHLCMTGWQTAFRRKVFEHVLGVPEKPRKHNVYKDSLRKSCARITHAIVKRISFRFIETREFKDFEIWLIHKYNGNLWNTRRYVTRVIRKDYSSLEAKLISKPLIPFSKFSEYLGGIPDKTGVYLMYLMS